MVASSNFRIKSVAPPGVILTLLAPNLITTVPPTVAPLVGLDIKAVGAAPATRGKTSKKVVKERAAIVDCSFVFTLRI